MFHARFKIILIFSLGFWREHVFQTFEERLDLLSLVSFLDWVGGTLPLLFATLLISHTVSANHQNAVHIPDLDQGSCVVVTSAIRAITGFAGWLDVVSCSVAELLISSRSEWGTWKGVVDVCWSPVHWQSHLTLSRARGVDCTRRDSNALY